MTSLARSASPKPLPINHCAAIIAALSALTWAAVLAPLYFIL